MSTMNERAHEILKRTEFNRSEIRYCVTRIAKVIKSLKKGNCPDTCPLPHSCIEYDPFSYFCCSCSFFYLGIEKPGCGCSLIERGLITHHQAICGLHRFSTIIKNYLKKKGTD